jgi:hypothetical protein
MIKRIVSLMLMSLVAACGGSGDGGASLYTGNGTTTGGTTGGTAATGTYAMTVDVQRAGASTTQVSSTETVQAVATVTTRSGSPVQGIVVTFSQTPGTLLTFAPAAATALTDASGKATLDLAAANASNTGATSVQAAGSVGTVALTASKSIQITAGTPVSGTTPVPAAINFVGAVPSGTAIVVKGAGGNGRSESAILTFKIVDASNAPINGAKVDFTLNANNGGATIASGSSAVSNSDGSVTVTVASGTTPASIVVSAVSDTVPTVTSQSDTLLVSNSLPVVGGFEIVSNKYNLDGGLTGDTAVISAFVRDQFGNPVPDGVAVSFQTDYGAVATSTLGGCATVNGTCTVNFRVEDPRGAGVATVIGTVRVGSTSTLVAQLQINMAAATGTSYTAEQTATAPFASVQNVTLTSCKQTFEYYLSDGNGHSVSDGTVISSPLQSTGVTVSIKSGSPVPDQLDPTFAPTAFGFEVDLTATTLAPLCNPAGTVQPSPLFFNLQFVSSGGHIYTQRVGLSYPQ